MDNLKKILICLMVRKTRTWVIYLDPNCKWFSPMHSTSASYLFPTNKLISSLLGFLLFLIQSILYFLFQPSYECSIFLQKWRKISFLKLLILYTLIVLNFPACVCDLKFCYLKYHSSWGIKWTIELDFQPYTGKVRGLN